MLLTVAYMAFVSQRRVISDETAKGFLSFVGFDTSHNLVVSLSRWCSRASFILGSDVCSL